MLVPRNLNAFYISLIDWAQLDTLKGYPTQNLTLQWLLVVGYWLWVIGCGLLVRMQIGSPVYLTILPKTNNRQPTTDNQQPQITLP